MYYSYRWDRIETRKNVDVVRVTLLDANGQQHVVQKCYEGWIGVCTSRIEKVVESIEREFPGHRVHCQPIGTIKKILPYFQDRLARNKLDYRSKPFYKVYTSASIHGVGRLFNRYKYSYYGPDDWLIRIYIDFCNRFNTHSFYYRWYALNESPHLLEALHMIPDRKDQPDWTVAAFDLETVSLKGNHIPMGHHPLDRIVMISLYKWHRQSVQTWILYLLPDGIHEALPGYEHAFTTESAMLTRFHELLSDVQIITGYNINAFDFPCLFARLLCLRLYSHLKLYRSARIGMDVVVSYDQKITLDLYTYFKTFSHYNLPSFKLDDVARIKLKDDTKIPIKATGIWSWYRTAPMTRALFEEGDVATCFRILQPDTVSRSSEYGTFRMYLDYCLKDSELVYRLFEKELVLSFLVERANFTSLNAVEALHFGNSRYLLELFQTYGTRLGYFINTHFFRIDTDRNKFLLGSSKTYQGALNYCHAEHIYENVSVMDFASMYPSALRSSNLCYGTCTIMTRDEWLATPAVQSLTCLSYRQHSSYDFQQHSVASQFTYPPFDPERDAMAIVINQKTEAFLPHIVAHFIDMRQHHQRQWKATQDVYHYNVQLGIKILINSLYGVMANKDSPLSYLVIAMIIVTLSRYQLLGSYHFLKNRGYEVCYADTDSLMVVDWPEANCDAVNAFLGLPHVELKYEQRMKRLLILSKKRYVYEQMEGGRAIITKGFQKKINGVVEYMTDYLLKNVWDAHTKPDKDKLCLHSRGWVVWVDMLLGVWLLCRDPKKYSIYRKIKKLEEYVSKSCPAVKYLKKYPDRTEDHVEFTYSMADVASTEASNWVMDAADCQLVNYEQLFMSQKKIFCTLLNMVYWHLPDPTLAAETVLHAMRWKRFVHAELLHRKATGRGIFLMLVPGIKYTFSMKESSRGRKRKIRLA